MDTAEDLATVIGWLYDAALDPTLWSAALEQTCAFVCGCAAAIYSQDVALKRGVRYHSWGDDPAYTRLYFSEYVKINPLLPHFSTQPVGSVYCASTLMPYEELRASRFFREWVVPQGLVDFVGTTLDKTTTSVATVSLGRSKRQGLADAEARYRMSLLAPHFRRAVLIDNVIDLHKIEATAFAEALNGLASGVFLLDANCLIVLANAAGQAMLEHGRILRAVQGKLTPLDRSAEAALRDLVGACAAGGDEAIGIKGIAVPLGATTDGYCLAHVLPLTSGARRKTARDYSAVAVVFARCTPLDLAASCDTIARVYQLTPSELAVLRAVVETAGVRAIAAELGISDSTVKTHLQHVFDKTGTRRQADLVKLVAAYASPLIG
ncbi:MAG TPA: LuxR C-terminal-related transcriptional regulator [Xanthobacteraceae bacterium]|jgi:DNA-binding CsgD family transcriptional regulator|nr:LuxR C-terminal-related transcriptional regulator [Xanthobacteraceae bacterium]